MTPQRILIVRLDRLGDVVLSTPVAQVLRQAYPQAEIAMLVRPACAELVQTNPHLTRVLVYDKDGAHRGIIASIRFAMALRAERFDLALVLHPSNRSHWLPFLAGIPMRVGYGRKTAWLLSRRLAPTKDEGRRHESEYVLDVVRAIGVPVPTPPPAPIVVPPPEASRRAADWLRSRGVTDTDQLIALHPSASDPVKRWPAASFAALGDRLAADRSARIVIVSGAAEQADGHAVASQMRTPPLDASGQLSPGALAALLTRCRLLISNDSGPVHIAAAVGTPVISLFGRNHPGLGPRRWGPIGKRHLALHKHQPPDAAVCCDAQCDRPFQEVASLTIDEVHSAASDLLSRQ